MRQKHCGRGRGHLIPTPFALSLSKGCPVFPQCNEIERQCFDKLSTNGVGGFSGLDRKRDTVEMIGAHIKRSTCNVFADVGLSDASERQTKMRLTLVLNLLV
jgi:hypothetical protein